MPATQPSMNWKPLAIACCAVALCSLAACGGGGGGSTVSLANSPTGGSNNLGGGGASVTQSPYLLFANDYIRYTTPVGGSYVHSIQGGNIYAQTSGYTYGFYDSTQSDANRTGFYNYQFQTDAAPAGTDYAQLVLLAPGGGSLDISQANTMLITLGNTQNPSTATPSGHATVYTIVLTDGNTATSDTCSYDQTLTYVGSGPGLGPNNTGPSSALGVRNYAIPLSSFTCSSGSLAGLQSHGLTTVVVVVKGSNNPNLLPNEFDTIAVGTIGFTNWAQSAADVTALSQ